MDRRHVCVTALLVVVIVASALVPACNAQMTSLQHLARQSQELELWLNLANPLTTNNTNPLLAMTESSKPLLSNTLEELDTSFRWTLIADTSANISQQCIEDSVYFVESLLFNRSKWALEMMESSSLLPVGLVGGWNIHAEGLFDECLAIKVPDGNRFRGQYCSVFFRPEPVDPSEITREDLDNSTITSTHSGSTSPLLVILRSIFGPLVSEERVQPKTADADAMTYVMPSLSLCLPSSCSALDVRQAISHLIGSYVIANKSIVTIADEHYCFSDNNGDQPNTLDGPTLFFIVIFGTVGVLVLTATIHDGWRTYCNHDFDAKSDAGFVTGLHCFSALHNGKKLLSLEPTSSGSDNLSCLHGIRFLSTCWVVIGHTWLKGLTSNVLNPKIVEQEVKSWQMESIINATVSVDSFFLMSGLLVSYLLLKELDRNAGRINVGMLYLHRYLRLTPVYAFFLGFAATLMVYVGTGPYWYNVVVASEGCRVTWWKQFLYINNFFATDLNVQCMEVTWYLAVDMQLFLLAPFFIYPLWRWRKAGFVLMSFFTFASVAANFVVYIVYNNFPPTFMPTRTSDMMGLNLTYMDNYYFKPWIRAPPYMIGIWTGWFLRRTKNSKLYISKWFVTMLWVTSAAIGGSIIYGLTPYLDDTLVPTIDSIVSLTYGPFHRAAWGLALAWVIIACIHGYGGFVDRLLSWRGFLPLSRLTYCVYLIHYDYLNIFYSLNRRVIYYSFKDQLTTFFGVSVTIFGLAFVVAVMVEAPFLNLERWVFSSTPKEKAKSTFNGTNGSTDNPDSSASNDVESPDANSYHVNAAFTA